MKIMVDITQSPKLRLGLAILSGVLFLLSLPPFEFGWLLAWIAFVPILIAVYYETKSKNKSRLLMIVSLFGLPLCIWGFFWIPDLLKVGFPDPPIWLLIILYIVGFLVSFIIAIGYYGGIIGAFWSSKSLKSSRLKFIPSSLAIIILPLFYTTSEFLILNIPGLIRIGGTFGLVSIAKTQWANISVLQIASFTGMYGITFLIMLVNCSVAYLIIHHREIKRVSKPALIIICLTPLMPIYSLVSVPSEVEGDITIAVLQSPPKSDDITADYITLCQNALVYNPYVIVLPGLIIDGLQLEQAFVDFSHENNVYILGMKIGSAEGIYGVVTPDSDFYLDNFGNHFGTMFTYLMTGDIVGFFFPIVYSLDTNIGSFGVVDCMESGSSFPTRERVRDGAQFLIVPTGGPNVYAFSWALGTSAIYRAVEHRMFAVEVIGDYHSSIIIDPYGRIITDIAPEPEIVVGNIAFTDERTFYTACGDIFGWICVSIALLITIYNSYKKRKSPFKYCGVCGAEISKDAKICEKCGANLEKPPLWKRILLHEYYEHKKPDWRRK